MIPRPDHASAETRPWTCPFCPLLCDGFQVEAVAGLTASATTLNLVGSDCAKARRALTQFDAPAGDSLASPAALVNGQPSDLDAAVAAAARLLSGSRQPLFAGMGCDVAGARALYTLSALTGAICDSTNGTALMTGLRALQDRGGFTTTLAEVRTRADVIVCVGGVPSERLPEFFRRCGVFDGGVPTRHIVVIDGADADQTDPASGDLAVLAAVDGVTVEHIALHSDLFTTTAELAALAAGRGVLNAPEALVSLVARLKAAQYGVIVWETARLPAQGALIIETLNRLIGALNRSTRAAGLPLGGGGGAGTVNHVYAWLSGLPMRSRNGPLGLEHEPLAFDTARLLEADSVDSLLWVSSFGADDPPPATTLPTIVIGHPLLAASVPGAAVFIAVSTPGIGADGHLFRTDGSVLMPLHALPQAVRTDSLPSVGEVVGQITAALKAGAT